MPDNVWLVIGQGSFGYTADGNQPLRLDDRDQPLRIGNPFTNLDLCGVPIGLLALVVTRVGWHHVPEDHAPFRAELFQQAVDDRSRWLFPEAITNARAAVGAAAPAIY